MSIRLLCAAAAALAFGASQAQPLQLKVLGQPVGSGLIQKNKEQPFFEKLAASSGLNISVQYRHPGHQGHRATARDEVGPVRHRLSAGVAELAG